MGGTPGEAYQAFDWGEAWADHSKSMNAYGEQRYAHAAAAVRRALEKFPDHAGLNYNYACFATLAGEVDDEMFAGSGQGVEGLPPFREQARGDEDLAAVRDDPRFEEALASARVADFRARRRLVRLARIRVVWMKGHRSGTNDHLTAFGV